MDAAVVKVALRKPHPPEYVVNLKDNKVVKVMYGHNVSGGFNWETDIFESWAVYPQIEPSVTQLISGIHVDLPINGEIRLPATTATSRNSRSASPSTADPIDSVYDAMHKPYFDQYMSNLAKNSQGGWLDKVTNRLNGSGTDFSRFADHVSKIGITIGTSNWGSGNRIKVACTSAGGGTPVCEMIIY